MNTLSWLSLLFCELVSVCITPTCDHYSNFWLCIYITLLVWIAQALDTFTLNMRNSGLSCSRFVPCCVLIVISMLKIIQKLNHQKHKWMFSVAYTISITRKLLSSTVCFIVCKLKKNISSKHRSSRQGLRWRVENVLSSGKCWLLLNYQTNSHYISKERSNREYNINVRMQQKYHISDLLGNTIDEQAEPHCTKRTS